MDGVQKFVSRSRCQVMYGLPGSTIQFGAKRAGSKPGRKSAKAVFLEKQRDLFPVDLYTSTLPLAARRAGAERAAARSAARTAARSAALPPVTNRGGKSKDAKSQNMAESQTTNTETTTCAGALWRE